jgi:hypothetical protein
MAKTTSNPNPDPAATNTYTPTELLIFYARQHDRQVGGTCNCLLCVDLRLLLARARSEREAKRRGG